jgi:MFS transporter, DHA1 family, multidrug resistance protein
MLRENKKRRSGNRKNMEKGKAFFLAVLASLGVVSASLCAPALPYIADRFSLAFSSVQFAISFFLVGNALGQFFSGPCSDRIGQRKVLLWGLCLYILASLAATCAEGFFFLLAARFFQGMGSAVGPVLARAIATKEGDRAPLLQSYGAMGIGAASIFSILCSGVLTFVSWRANFALATLLGLVLLVWAYIQQKELPSSSAPYNFVAEMKNVLKEKIFIRALLCHAFTYGLMYAYIAMFPFILQDLRADTNAGMTGLYSAFMILCYMVGTFVAARFVERFAKERLIVLGVLLQLFSGVILCLSKVPFLALVALILFNVSLGIILPMTIASALAPFANRSAGLASSLLGTGYRLIGSVMCMLLCLLPVSKALLLGVGIVFFSLLMLPLSFLLYQKRELQNSL